MPPICKEKLNESPLSFEMAYGGLGVPDEDIEQLTTALPLCLHLQAQQGVRAQWGDGIAGVLAGAQAQGEGKNPRKRKKTWNLEGMT